MYKNETKEIYVPILFRRDWSRTLYSWRSTIITIVMVNWYTEITLNCICKYTRRPKRNKQNSKSILWRSTCSHGRKNKNKRSLQEYNRSNWRRYWVTSLHQTWLTITIVNITIISMLRFTKILMGIIIFLFKKLLWISPILLLFINSWISTLLSNSLTFSLRLQTLLLSNMYQLLLSLS